MASFAHKSVSKTVTSLARTVREKSLGVENNDAGDKQPNTASKICHKRNFS